MTTLLPLLVATMFGLAATPTPPHETHAAGASSPPLPSAHAHNDYEHDDPCHGALNLGFRSLEVDVFPVGDDLLVGHDPEDLVPERTIERLYLEPLRRWCASRPASPGDRGMVDPKTIQANTIDDPALTLLVDIKRAGPRALELLLRKLEPLQPWLTRVTDGDLVPGRITVILSGNRPVAEVAALADRVVFIDGRPGDLERNPPVTLVPLVSGSYGPTLRTPLIGAPSDDAIRRLRRLTDLAHAQGRRIRFWGHLEDPRIWSAFVEAGVDLIGTDDRARLADWLRTNDPRCGGDAPSGSGPMTDETPDHAEPPEDEPTP